MIYDGILYLFDIVVSLVLMFFRFDNISNIVYFFFKCMRKISIEAI